MRAAPFVVSNGVARAHADPLVALKGGDFSDLKQWVWKDDCVAADQGSARVTDPKGQNVRIVQKLQLTPFRQYHLSMRVRTQDFRGTPEVKASPATARGPGRESLHHVARRDPGPELV